MNPTTFPNHFRIVHPTRGFLAQVPPYNPLEFVRPTEAGGCLMYRTREEAETAMAALGLRGCRVAEYTVYGRPVEA